MVSTSTINTNRGHVKCQVLWGPVDNTPEPKPAILSAFDQATNKSLRLAGDRRREALAMIDGDSHEIVWMDRFLECYCIRRRANAGDTYTVDMIRLTCSCPDCVMTLAKHNREARAAGVDWDVLDKHILWISYLLDRETQGFSLPMADDCPAPPVAAAREFDTRHKGDFSA